MVLGQYMTILAGTWWYWVSMSWYYLVLSGTGSVMGFYVYIEEEKSGDLVGCHGCEYLEADKQTDSNV